ncbi:hypothetical protein [Streptomyces collinus]|uniref:hypothetical protein n=1 Tax=Streptomyces collinus TaxID=42684 RepID=UPI003627757D
MTAIGGELGAQAARSRALAVLRVRGRALAVALLPAAAGVILLTGGSTGHLVGPGWDTARWVVGVVAVVVLLAAAGVALVVARARPAVTPTVPVSEESAPDLYRLVRDLADRLDVPAPSAIALTPDCDSWLEDRTHPAHGPPARPAHDEPTAPGPGSGPGGHRRPAIAPVLVIGSPFLWWMRVGELRAVLAPVVAGTGPSAHPDIAAARRFVRGLDATVAVASTPGRCPLTRGVCAVLGWVARLLLRGCREHAVLMERGVAAAAAERAQAVDYGLRIVAQEQVGLAYAGWDRLLTRVALPAWRMGRWPSRLDAGVVAALTELSRRDRLAEGFASRLGERPACDLLEEPGAIDEAASLLAARLFHGGPAECGPDWAPVDWQAYPEEVVDRTWRADAARLHRVLDSLGVRPAPGSPAAGSDGPTLARVLDHLTEPGHAERSDQPAPATAPRTLPRPEDKVPPHPEVRTPLEPVDASPAGAVDGSPREAVDANPSEGAEGSPSEPVHADPAGAADASPAKPAGATPAGAVDGSPREAVDGSPAAAVAPTRPEATTDQAGPAAQGRADAPLADAATDAPLADAATDAPLPDAAADAPHLDAAVGAPLPDAAASAQYRDAAVDAPHLDAAAGARLPDAAIGAQYLDAAADAQLPDAAAGAQYSVAPADAPLPDAPADAPHLDATAGAQLPDAPHSDAAAGTLHPDASAATDTPHPDACVAADTPHPDVDPDEYADPSTERSAVLAAGLSAELAREEIAAPRGATASGLIPDSALWDDGALSLFPLQPPRGARELLADHVTAMVCCAAVDTAGAAPGLDWLDGPSLVLGGERAADLAPKVLRLIEEGDPRPLRDWLAASGIRPEKPVRLV